MSTLLADKRNDASTHDAANTNKTLLPGYIPKQSDPDYIGELFKNALNSVDIEGSNVA
jgi:hypothetical protein